MAEEAKTDADAGSALDDETIKAVQDVVQNPTGPSSPGGALGGLAGVPRVVSLIVLLGVVLLIGVLFFRVMSSFLVPLFLAAVLTVVFKPLHDWTLSRLPGRKRLAALATTVMISLGVIVPTALLGWMAYSETTNIVKVALSKPDAGATASREQAVTQGESADTSPVEASADLEVAEADATGGWAGYFEELLAPVAEWYQENINAEFDPTELAQYAASNAVHFGLVGVQAIFGFLFGLTIMVFALYYFLADGPAIIETLMHLSPLDDDYERELLGRFSDVSRAVVLATIVSAIAQGLLGGIGYYVTLDSWTPSHIAEHYGGEDRVPDDQRIEPPIFLLTVATMLLAIVPFLGATAVWIPVTLWLFFVQESWVGGVGMAVYGFAFVSSIDNFIKPYVLHGQSNLHPLLALLSVLGGLQLLGPIGILVGPMLVAFMQALLEMLRKELDVFQAESEPEPA